MKVKEQKEHIRGLIAETITLLCKSGLEYKANFSIEALIGITLDDSDVLLVNINETVLGKNDSAAKHPGPLLLDNGQGKESGELADENRQAAKRNRKRKRKNSDPTKLTPHVTPAKQSKSKEFVPETASDDDDGPRDDPLSGPSVHMERDEHEIGIVLVKEELIGNSFREDTENDTLYQSAFPPADNGSGSFLNESLPSMPVDPESMGGLAIWSTEGASQMNSSTPGGSQTHDGSVFAVDDVRPVILLETTSGGTRAISMQTPGKAHRKSMTKTTPSPKEKTPRKKYRQYTEEQIKKALTAIKEGLTSHQAAKRFGIPSTTLRRETMKRMSADYKRF